MSTTRTSGSPTPRANARGERARLRLLDAALSAFATQGFHGTSTRDIAEAAAMSPAAVYVHYRTKEELLFQLSLHGHREIRRVVETALGRPEPPAARLRGLVADYTAWHARSHVQARVLQYEFAALLPEHAEQIAAIRGAIEAMFQGAITDGVDAGIFRIDDVKMTSLALLSLGIDVARWFRPGGARSPDEIGNYYGEIALRVCGHPGDL
ncbi:TetR/AcrR family transcriptional regulator [Nocardioides sp. JS614]|uniref:TetR/AcrR family transcriptional regulator n=1 Tax=Nocardioides sp. (strain ATCC BAA-499 / JS614) TaxID=196162 RepID=UPI001EE4B780|nr:TetR/AcrR family transcriptional regulator [Nocardioides sp. JS614]